MNGKAQKKHKPIFVEGNYTFPELKPDPGLKKFNEAVAKSGLPSSWVEIGNMLRTAKTEEEWQAISKKIPMLPGDAIFTKKTMGKEAFLAQGYNLDYANEELGGPEWMDRY